MYLSISQNILRIKCKFLEKLMFGAYMYTIIRAVSVKEIPQTKLQPLCTRNMF